MDGDNNYSEQAGQDYYSAMFSKLKDLEEKQRVIKDRALLVGENLIETKEETRKDILEMKKEIEKLKMDFERMKSFIETLSGEFPKFARKDDLEVLRKFMKMFQPFALSREGELQKS